LAQIAVLSFDGRIAEALQGAGFKTAAIPSDGLPELARAGRAPLALVVDVRGQPSLPAGLAAFRKQHAGAGIVVVLSSLDPGVMLEAMRAGANECVAEPLSPEALEQAVRRVIVDGISEPLGQMVAFVGSKGGVGTTTIAANTAAAFARANTGSVLLIDLHVGYGDAALFLGVEPRFSMLDALENVHRVDASFFKGLVEKAKGGVDVLGASDRAPHGGLDPVRLRAVLDVALRTYTFVVLDVPRSDRAILDALEAASTLVVVSSQDLSGLRNAGRLAHALRSRYGKGRVKTVVSRLDRLAEIAHADVERVIGDTVSHVVPSDYRAAVDALNAGRPLVFDDGKLAESLRDLAGTFGGVAKPARERTPGVLGRLAFRRV
jgi:pilus assembly protein CpaE